MAGVRFLATVGHSDMRGSTKSLPQQPVARPQLAGLGVVAGADEIAQRLARLVGDPDRGEIAGAQQPGELGRVPAVGLHPVAGPGRDERRRDVIVRDRGRPSISTRD
jgi:hypothetical protein